LGDSADVLRTPQAPSAKRARTHDGDTSLFSSVLSFPGRIYDWMTTKVNIFSVGRRGPAPTPTTDEDVSSDDTDGGGAAVDADSDQPIDMSRRRIEEPVREDPPLLDLTRDDQDEKDEIQIVEERLVSPAGAKEPSTIPFGAMSYGPLFQRQHTFNIVTRERREKDRARAHPKSIYEAVRKSKLKAATRPAVDTSFWLSKTSKGSRLPPQEPLLFKAKRTTPFKPSVSRGTPKIDPKSFVKPDEYNQYATILYGKNSGVQFSPYGAFNTSSLKKLSRSSLFSFTRKQKSSAVAIGAISVQKFTSPGQEKEIVSSARKAEPAEVVALKDEEEPRAVTPPAASTSSAPLRPSSRPSPTSPKPFKPKNLRSQPDADVIEIIDIYSPPGSPKKDTSSCDDAMPRRCQYKEEVDLNPLIKDDFLTQLRSKYVTLNEESERLIREAKISDKHNHELTEKMLKNVVERTRRHLKLSEVAIEDPPPVIESSESEEEEEEEEIKLPEITDEMEEVIQYASQSRGETLVDAHTIKITRKDIDTLKGLNWLNDEVINFYMQMIVARSKDNDNWPKVYATNTFFYPKLMQSGHSALKRWTRKVDIFAQDLMIIPVHLGMHWCLATIDFKKKGVFYYDSMGGNNNQCLNALLKYLQDEHLDKKKSTFDISDWKAVIVKEIPQQMNGSDCGMFTCKFAEYLSRNAPITFSQADMPYFRKRIIYEIVKNQLIHP